MSTVGLLAIVGVIVALVGMVLLANVLIRAIREPKRTQRWYDGLEEDERAVRAKLYPQSRYGGEG